MFQWIDNNIVKMVSNVHMGSKDEAVIRPRKKPRLNEFNRKHIRLVWGTDHVVTVKIPQIINDYNHWMLGVDLVDQLIAYYRPKIRCRRTWMPVFLHGTDIIRVNSYVLYKETAYDHPDVNDGIKSHKQFLIAFINSLIHRAQDEEVSVPTASRTRTWTPLEPVIHLNKTGQLRFSRNDPSLSIFDHLRFLPGDHVLITTKQRKCKYCQYSSLVAKLAVQPIPTEERIEQLKRIMNISQLLTIYFVLIVPCKT